MNRKHMHTLTRLLIGLLLLVQMAVAAYVCPATSAPAQAMNLVAPLASSAGPDMPDCHGMGSQGADTDNPALCAEHCRYGQQGDHAPSLTVVPTLLTALYTVTPQEPLPLTTRGQRASTLSALASASPPHTLLHCCFRI